MVRFYARAIGSDVAEGGVSGPHTVAEVRALLERGVLGRTTHELRREEGAVWGPIDAWTALQMPAERPARHLPQSPDAPPIWMDAFLSEGEHLRWWVRRGGRDEGPIDGASLKQLVVRAADYEATAEPLSLEDGLGAGWLALVGGSFWMPMFDLRQACAVVAEADSEPGAVGAPAPAVRPVAAPPPASHHRRAGTPGSHVEDVGAWSGFEGPLTVAGAHTICCAICLELIPANSPLCPECGEPPAPAQVEPPSGAASFGPRSMAPSIAEDPPDASWLRLHWRPLITMSVVGAVLATGIALRHLAPDRYRPPKHISPPAAAAVCDSPCWHGEACQVGRCVWQVSNDVGHVHAEPVFSGPFELSHDVIDVAPIDDDRFASSSLKGVVIHSARTGEVLSLVSDAPQAQHLARVGSVLYATSPKRIYVIDAESTRVLKTIEVGSPVHQIAVGAQGRQALASVPNLHAVLVIATDYHAEINRFYFGEDAIGPVALDDTGKRGLVTTGRTPLPGLPGPRGGALYAFDPSRLASEQDRVRAAMVGNPVDLVMVPDDETSYVALREQSQIVPLERLPTGTVRRGNALETCEQPEQIELIRRGRRAIVRCNLGRTIEVFDLDQRTLIRHIPLNARAADLAVSPDGRQALVALPHEGGGALGLLDLKSYELSLNDLGDEPDRVRLTPDGRTAVAISDRSKVAWVVR